MFPLSSSPASFFNLPELILENILDKFSATKLLEKIPQLNRQGFYLATKILFQRSDDAARACQKQLMKNWSMSSQNSLNYLNDYNKDNGNQIIHLIKERVKKSSDNYKLTGLVCLAKQLKYYLPDESIERLSLKYLLPLVLILTPGQRTKLIQRIQRLLLDKRAFFIQQGLEAVEALLPHLSSNEQLQIVSDVINNVANADIDVSYAAGKILVTMLPHLQPKKQQEVIEAVISIVTPNKFNDDAKLKKISPLFSYLKPNEQQQIREKAMERFYLAYPHFASGEILHALSTLFFYFNPDERQQILDGIIDALAQNICYITYSALQALDTLFLHLQPNEQLRMVDVMIEKLMIYNPGVQCFILKILSNRFSNLQPSIQQRVVDAVMKIKDTEVLERVVTFFSPYLKQDEQQQIVDALMKRKNPHELLDLQMPYSLITLFPRLKAEEQQKIIAVAIEKLEDTDSSVRETSLTFLTGLSFEFIDNLLTKENLSLLLTNSNSAESAMFVASYQLQKTVLSEKTEEKNSSRKRPYSSLY
ncbi:MAG: hypothetical protein QM652_05460 [Legionella sp.]|uniref:hypothetical protein n=1 Tax=Legionella sp. TaxID=459 RepID=UPI0039E3678D